MKREFIEQALYERFILPTEREEGGYAGVEFEIPIVNLSGNPVDFETVHHMTDQFISEFQADQIKKDDIGNICSAGISANGDDLSFDCSYNTLELSFGREADLKELDRRYRRYIKFIKKNLEEQGHTVTGMGINPNHRVNRNTPIPNGRYRMLLHHLSSYKNYEWQMLFHDIPHYGLIICSSQTHIDVSKEHLVQKINAFNRAEPLKALLFANSPYLGGYLCVRDHFWRESMHGINQHNVDCWDIEPESIEEVLNYIRSMSLYCTERDERYINFYPKQIDEFFKADDIRGEYYCSNGFEEIHIVPQPEDLQYLRSFKFVDLTFRGTIELRSACMQPLSEAMTVPAFNIGLNEKTEELDALLKQAKIYHEGYSVRELRNMFVMEELPAFAESRDLSRLLIQVVELAWEGLKKRGKGEEIFLEPLKNRAEKLMNPAKEAIWGMKKGRSADYYIRKYGEV